jgi:hypothetical protein
MLVWLEDAFERYLAKDGGVPGSTPAQSATPQQAHGEKDFSHFQSATEPPQNRNGPTKPQQDETATRDPKAQLVALSKSQKPLRHGDCCTVALSPGVLRRETIGHDEETDSDSGEVSRGGTEANGAAGQKIPPLGAADARLRAAVGAEPGSVAGDHQHPRQGAGAGSSGASARVCLKCGLASADVQLYTIDGKAVNLHRTCVPFYRKNPTLHPSIPDLPGFLDRRSDRGAS